MQDCCRISRKYTGADDIFYMNNLYSGDCNNVSLCVWLCVELMPVSSVSVDYTCTTHSGMVFWSAVFGAESYKAFATGDNGTELTCMSQGTSCQISGLTCGQSYVVHVIPMSASCTNMINTTSATFQTGETEHILNIDVSGY